MVPPSSKVLHSNSVMRVRSITARLAKVCVFYLITITLKRILHYTGSPLGFNNFELEIYRRMRLPAREFCQQICRGLRSPFSVVAGVLISFFLASCPQVSRAQSHDQSGPEIRKHLQQAQTYLMAHDPAGASMELHAVLALDPKNVDAHANLGIIAFFEGNCKEASRQLRSALHTDPSLVKAEALLGICEARLGESSGKDLLEKSFARLKDPKLRTQVGMELLGIYEQEGDLESATSLAQKLVDLNPDNVEILYQAQRIYSELADDTLNKLAILAPGSARMQQVIAERLINDGDLKDAIEHYRKALEIDPRLPGVHYELGEAILQSSSSDPNTQAQAQKEFQAAADMEGDTAKIECELGRIAMFQSDWDHAFEHYQRAHELNPNDVQAQLGLAQLLIMRKQPQAAMKYLEACIQLDPLNEEAHYRLANAYRTLGMNDKAHKEMHLFEEIKKAQDQLRTLYYQMNRHLSTGDDPTPNSNP
jgi:tetratricopeptide (TPR) repeat protein